MSSEPPEPTASPESPTALTRRDFVGPKRDGGRRVDDRPAPRARPGPDAAERSRQHRRRRHPRHGRRQRAGRDEPEHRRDLRRRRRAASTRRLDAWKRSLQPRPPHAAAPAARRPQAATARPPRRRRCRGSVSVRRRCSVRPTRSGGPTQDARAAAALRRGAAAAPEDAIATTARCWRSRKTSTRSSSRRPITCTRRSRRRRWRPANTSTCRSRCAGRWPKRGTSRRRPRPIRSSSRRWAIRATRSTRRGAGRTIWRPASSATSPKCTSGPIVRSRYWPQGVPRPKKFDGDWKTLGWSNRGVTERLAHVFTNKVKSQRAEGPALGSVPRRGARRRVPPALPSVQLARLGRLGPGRARRHGRAPRRSSGVGPEARLADVDRDDLDAVQRRELSDGDDDVLRVPGARTAGRR